jgi:hypothetical protein
MKWVVMNTVITYAVACADFNEYDDSHTKPWKVMRAVFWPITVTCWLRSQSIRTHRLLTIMWILLISGWLLSLVADRF